MLNKHFQLCFLSLSLHFHRLAVGHITDKTWNTKQVSFFSNERPEINTLHMPGYNGMQRRRILQIEFPLESVKRKNIESYLTILRQINNLFICSIF